MKPCQGTRETAPDLLSTCLLVMEFRLDATLCSNLGQENSDAGQHISFHAGRGYAHPCTEQTLVEYSFGQPMLTSIPATSFSLK